MKMLQIGGESGVVRQDSLVPQCVRPANPDIYICLILFILSLQYMRIQPSLPERIYFGFSAGNLIRIVERFIRRRGYKDICPL
jgi:hypothetical protein